jgi:hypothetical protein
MPWSATFRLARMCLWRAPAAEEKFWHFGVRAIRRRGLNAIRRSSTPATRSLTSWAKHVAFFFAHRTRFRLAPLHYSAVIIGWTAYSHIPSRQRREAFLRALRQRAFPDSPVLLSFFARPGSSGYDVLAFRIANSIRSLLGGRKEPVELGDHLNWSYSHWFTREEIESELQEAGIRLVDFGEVGEGYAVGIVE